MTGMRELIARLRKKADEMETAGVIAGRLQRDALICEDACVEHADLERQAASAIDRLSTQVEELRGAQAARDELLSRVLTAADTGAWRDRAELSFAAHPVMDDIREALREARALASEQTGG